MGIRSLARVIAIAAVTYGAPFACTSFSAATTTDVDASTPAADSAPGLDGFEAPDTSDAAAPDPCAGSNSPHFEYAGLYIVDGYIIDDAGAQVARASVLRAPRTVTAARGRSWRSELLRRPHSMGAMR